VGVRGRGLQLRSHERRVIAPVPEARERPVAWWVPIGLVGAFVVLALLTLPKGPPL